MTITLTPIKAIAACAALFIASAYADPLSGNTGSAAGDRWQSSWLDLNSPVSFKKGDELRITVEGNAENVIVRLLPKASRASSSDGIEGKVRKVPANGILEVRLERDHPNVKQISVHAGTVAWGTPLGGNNGKVKVVAVDHSSQ